MYMQSLDPPNVRICMVIIVYTHLLGSDVFGIS